MPSFLKIYDIILLEVVLMLTFSIAIIAMLAVIAVLATIGIKGMFALYKQYKYITSAEFKAFSQNMPR